jgi:TolA-binding protein
MRVVHSPDRSAIMMTSVRAVLLLLVATVGCVTVEDIQRADDRDRACWASYRRMVWHGDRAANDYADRVDRKHASCLALDRKLERLTDEYEEARQQEDVVSERPGPSGGEVAAGIFKVIGAAMGGAAAAGAASRPTSTTCSSTNIGGTVTTNCTSQ